MKIKIKRKKTIAEAAKKPEDIPEGYFITMKTEGSEWARWDIVKGKANYYEKTYYPDAIYGHIDIGKIHQNRYGECLGAWMTRMADTAKGFGPMLYDIAMEYATESGSGLIADRGGVTPAAEGIWKKYLERDDVEAVQLENCVQGESIALNKMFKKPSTGIIQKLEEEGKLIRV